MVAEVVEADDVGVGPAPPGVIGCLPERERFVQKKSCALVVEPLSELKPPFAGRSQSVQSLSPGVNIAAFFSALN